MTSTIENLSPEILVKIFSHYIKSEGHMAFTRNVAPVCKTWWDVSSTPSLWNSFQVLNWNYARSLCNRGLLYHIQSLKLPAMNTSPGYCGVLLDSSHLSAVLSNINDLKSLEICLKFIDVNTMMIVAEHCPNLERLSMKGLRSGKYGKITLGEMDPVLNICGPKLKHLSFIQCYFEDSEQLFTEIAAKCKSLETFELSDVPFFFQGTDRSMFPIYKFVSGCPRLRKLELSNYELVSTGENDCPGFEDLTVFKAARCYCNGLDMCNVLKNSINLEYLELDLIDSLVFSDVSKISSNNVKFLNVQLNVMDTNVEAVKEAVDKWKHTLLHLRISTSSYDLTDILKIYLDDNSSPKLEVLSIDKECVDLNLLKVFVQKCQNLKQLNILLGKGKKSLKRFMNREEVIKFLDSI